MPQPTNFNASILFGAKVDGSLGKAIQQVQKQLGSIQQNTDKFSDSVGSIGTKILGIGTAFLGLRTGIGFFQDAHDAAQRLNGVTNELHANIDKLLDLRGNTNNLKSSLEGFNEQLSKTSIYSKQITETFESGLIGAGFKNAKQIESLTEQYEKLAAAQHKQLTPEQAATASQDLATAVKTGGQGGIDALRNMGFSLTRAQQQQFRSIVAFPGNEDAAYTKREQFIDGLQQGHGNAFDQARKDPTMAQYNLNQSVTAAQGDLGQSIVQLLAPVEVELKKQIDDLISSGKLKELEEQAKSAGAAFKSFFTDSFEPYMKKSIEEGVLLAHIVHDALHGDWGAVGKDVKEFRDFEKKDNPEHFSGSQADADSVYDRAKGKASLLDGPLVTTLREQLRTKDDLFRWVDQAKTRQTTFDPQRFSAAIDGAMERLSQSYLFGPDASERKDIAERSRKADTENTDATKDNTAALRKAMDRVGINAQYNPNVLGLGYGGETAGQQKLNPHVPWRPGYKVAHGDGINITQFGYQGDPYADSASLRGEGAHNSNMIPDFSAALNHKSAAMLGVQPHQVFEFHGKKYRFDDAIPEIYKDARLDVYKGIQHHPLSGSDERDMQQKIEQEARKDLPENKTSSSAAPVIHAPLIVHIHGNADERAIASAHSSHTRHLHRTLQEIYRDERRTRYA